MTPAFDKKIYDSNMAVLKERFPELHERVAACDGAVSFPFQVIETSYGQVNISATLTDGKSVRFHEGEDIIGGLRHQMVDWQLNTQDFLFCVGLGLGYLPVLASQLFDTKPSIVVIEPNPKIFQLALASIDLRGLLAYERLSLYLGPDLPVAELIRSFGERIFFGKNRLVSHGPSRMIYPETFKALENEVVDNIRVARNIGYTAKQAGQKIFSNTIQNLPNLFSGPDLKSLKDRFKGCPAICVAAGPSLDKDLGVLKSVGDRALILCGDSAVRTLVNEGIIPHIVVTTDMNAPNFEKLRTSLHHVRAAVLVYSIESNPENVGSFLGRRRIAVTSKNAMLNQWIGPKWSLDWQLPAMTSVSHTALFTAMALGAGPIILVGMDFAYSSGKSHSSGSVFHYPTAIEEAIKVDGVKGYPVHSLPQLITDRKQIENAIATSEIRFIDTSLDGALIHGAENRSLQEVVDTIFSSDLDVSSNIEGIDWTSSVGNRSIIMEFDAMTERVDRFITTCRSHVNSCKYKEQDTGHNLKEYNDERRVVKVRHALNAFDRKNSQLLTLLKLIRYGDVKEIAIRMSSLKANCEAIADEKIVGNEELSVYADYFTSLEGAAQQFKSALLSVRQYFSNEAALAKGIENTPSNTGQILDLAHFYKDHGLLWKAEPAFQKYLDHHPDDKAVWLSLGLMFAQKGLWFIARTYSKKMEIRFPSAPAIETFVSDIRRSIIDFRHGAQNALDKGSMEEARRLLYEYLSLAEVDDTVRSLLEKIDEYDRDNRAVMLQPESVRISTAQKQVLGERIQDAIDSGAIEKAIGILEGLAQAEGIDSWQAREQIGDIRFSQRDLAGALWHYQKALEQSPQNDALGSKIRMTIQQTKKGAIQMENTMHHFKDQGIGPPSELETPEAMYGLAQSKIEQEAYSDAVYALEELLVRFPDYGLAHNDLGVLYFNQGDNEKSFFHYQQAARIEPENFVFMKNLADFMYIVMGEVQPALEIYVDLLSKDPMDKETLLALGQICSDQNKFDDAAVFYRRIQEFDPFDTDAEQGLAALSDRNRCPAPHPSSDRSHEGAIILTDATVEATPVFPSPIIKTEIVTDNRQYLVRIPEQEMFRVKSIFEQKEYAVMDKRRANGVYNVFDVGANVGIFALSVHSQHPNSKIYCFEPSPATLTLLEANVGELAETVICGFGLSDQNMEAAMHLHQYNTGQNSIRYSGSHHTGVVDVQVKDAGAQFDALGLSHLDILKIDTEGCEVEILESFGERLEKVDYVLVEYHSEKDRRAIDALLIRFHLFGAISVTPGVGTVKYVHPSLI